MRSAYPAGCSADSMSASPRRSNLTYPMGRTGLLRSTNAGHVEASPCVITSHTIRLGSMPYDQVATRAMGGSLCCPNRHSGNHSMASLRRQPIASRRVLPTPVAPGSVSQISWVIHHLPSKILPTLR